MLEFGIQGKNSRVPRVSGEQRQDKPGVNREHDRSSDSVPGMENTDKNSEALNGFPIEPLGYELIWNGESYEYIPIYTSEYPHKGSRMDSESQTKSRGINTTLEEERRLESILSNKNKEALRRNYGV